MKTIEKLVGQELSNISKNDLQEIGDMGLYPLVDKNNIIIDFVNQDNKTYYKNHHNGILCKFDYDEKLDCYKII